MRHVDDSLEKSNETLLKIREEGTTEKRKRRKKEPRELDPVMKVCT